MQVPGVAKSVAYGAVYTAVHVRIAPQEGKADANYMERLSWVETYMQDKIMIGSTVYPEPLDVEELWQDVYIRILVHVQDAFNRTAVRLQVDQVVRQLLAFNVGGLRLPRLDRPHLPGRAGGAGRGVRRAGVARHRGSGGRHRPRPGRHR